MIDRTVVIVGGGPAGAACAGKLKTAGIDDVIILDKNRFPRLKLCAGWVTPQVFRLLGTDPGAYPESIIPFKRLICHFWGRRAPIRTRQYSIRRYEFDAWLLEKSGAALEQHAVQRIRRENGFFIIDERYRAKYLVGAGGTHCPVYRELFRPAFPRSEKRRISTVEEEFRCEARDTNCYLWFFEDGLPGYGWYVPKGGGFVNVGIGGKYASIKKQGKTINAYWRTFKEKLIASGLVPDRDFNARGHVYYIRGRRPVLELGNAYLTGDAAGLASVDMGEGIGPAIQSGLGAARAIIEDRPCRMPGASRYSFPEILIPGIQALLPA